jgi:hypothetical protein
VLNGPYADTTDPKKERLFVPDYLHQQVGTIDDAYSAAAHIMLSKKYSRWWNDHDNTEKWDHLKERLIRWLKWHDKIRKQYVE